MPAKAHSHHSRPQAGQCIVDHRINLVQQHHRPAWYGDHLTILLHFQWSFGFSAQVFQDIKS
jgi:hypothetical protein